MTTFTREYFPFRVQASVGSATPDFEVSTNGAVNIATAGSGNFASLIVTGNAAVSGNVSVGGTTKLTGAVTAEGSFTVSGASRFVNGVSCEATVAILGPNLFLSIVSAGTPANFAAGALVAVKSAAGVVFRIPACSSAW